MWVSEKDKVILRELGKLIAELAYLPVQQETKRLWMANNSLRPERPMFTIDQIPWHEMDVNNELTLYCEDNFCRSIEQTLKRIIYKWNHMRDDIVVQPYITINKVITGRALGINTLEDVSASDPNNDVIGHHYIDQLQNEEDLQKIQFPKISLDTVETKKREEAAKEIFDGILGVRMMGAFPGFGIWDLLSMWHGVEEILYDLVDRPEFLHNMMERVTQASLSGLDQLEEQGLLGYDQELIHCTGAYSDELPAPGFNQDKPRAKDLWTFGMAQIFSSVSPAMHEEFEIDYQIRWFERFGLGYYGCCEPLDRKIGIIRRIPNVRKISMSPWVDVNVGAEAIGKDFVFSRKPSPAFLAGNTWDAELVSEDLRATLEACKRYSCPLEFILKDISTVRYKPQNLWEWADIAARIVGKA